MSSQKLSLDQKLLQKLSPQQIQFIKLLQLNNLELEQRINEELLENPGLETANDDESQDDVSDIHEDEISQIEDALKHDDKDASDDTDVDEERDDYEEIDDIYDVSEYINEDGDDEGFHLFEEQDDPNVERKEMPITVSNSFHEQLLTQFEAIANNEREELIGIQIIGSLDDDGYLHRSIDAICNDIAFSQNIEIPPAEIEKVLFKIQNLDPAGVAARTLQECLLLQLKRKDKTLEEVILATRIIENHCEDFVKKHYEKLMRSLKINDEKLKAAIEVIVKLTPKPGETEFNAKTQYIIPDFTVVNNNGLLEVQLNSRNLPDLRISRSYMDTLKSFEKNPKANQKLKDSVVFIKQKLDSAKWFIDSIKQRHETLLKTMRAIVQHQKAFFLEGEEILLKPMILKNIAEQIKMDISTVSRVANSKFVETEWGTFPLKYFFSEGIANDEGEEVSNREIKKIMSDCIAAEDKSKPMPDEDLMEVLKKKGYNIARRTVAKYREQLGIPVARLRREL